MTGAATGIGRAIAVALARQSIRVAICDINHDAAQKAAADIPGSTAVEIDVTKRASVESSFSNVLKQFGSYDILIANAGVSTMRHAVDLTDEEWDFNFSVNARGVFLHVVPGPVPPDDPVTACAAKRFEDNTTRPVIAVRIAGQEFPRVTGVAVPELADRVAAAMADKHWSDVFVRWLDHPLTLRLAPE